MLTQVLLLLGLTVAAVSPRGLIGRITRHPLLMKFGGYCYSIYLLHWAIVAYLKPLQARLFKLIGAENFSHEVRLLIWFPVVAAVCFTAGWACFNLIEKPCVRLGKRVVRKTNDFLLRANFMPRALKPDVVEVSKS